jgi:hypothetical protein
MTATEAQFLRDRWRLEGDRQCEHPLCDVEYGDDGSENGNYVCTTCGVIVRTRPARRISA